MAEQYIFTIERLSKAYAKREVLKNIWLAFYPGAKIGVIGSNGAGKSTLLRIMACEDKDFLGTARLTPGFSIGFVPQEPRLDETKDVRGNIEEAVAAHAGLADRASRSSATRWPRPRPGGNGQAAWTRWARCRTAIDAANAWELDRQLEIAMDAMRLPPRRCHGRPPCPAANGGAWPCARCCCKSPTCCCSTSRPTISTPSRSPGWNGICRNIRAPSWPSRTTAISSTTSPSGSSSWTAARAFPGRAIIPPGWSRKQQRLAKEEKQESARRKALARELEWAKMAPRARVAKSKARLGAYEKLAAQEFDERPEELSDADPAGAAPGRPGGPGRERPQGLRRQSADGGPELRPAARRHRRHHRRQRRRQDHAVPHDRRPGEAGRRQAARRRNRRAGLRRSEPRRPRRRPRPSSRKSPAAPSI